MIINLPGFWMLTDILCAAGQLTTSQHPDFKPLHNNLEKLQPPVSVAVHSNMATHLIMVQFTGYLCCLINNPWTPPPHIVTDLCWLHADREPEGHSINLPRCKCLKQACEFRSGRNYTNAATLIWSPFRPIASSKAATMSLPICHHKWQKHIFRMVCMWMCTL